jgi:acyl-coenzyme A synthetase/AMP-(fatty) acid ligase
MYAGEPFPVYQLRQLKEALPLVKIANIYGPTETNIITCYWIDHIEKDAKAIPLGWEVDDTEILIVHPEEKRLCNPNESGELWCRGGTVTLGYLGDEQKTAEHLVQSPFHPYPAKFWRTGDYGFRDDEGCLHYRGRRDHMVKIKGYRVELGEIESAIASLDLLDELCVLALKSEDQQTRLACIYSTKSKQPLTTEDFVIHLTQHVPLYMIPNSFHFNSELPKTSSGKIDRVFLASTFIEEKSQ